MSAFSPPSAPWTSSCKAAFDLETTGPDPASASIVTASIILTDGAGKIGGTYEWLVNPGVPIPEQATQIHGISTQKAQAEGMDPVQALQEINRILSDIWAQGYPVVAYNACYDFTVLAAEGARRKVNVVTPRFVLDPYILDKKVDSYRKGKRTLEAVCRHYGVPLDNAHTSAADALAAVRLIDALVKHHPELELPLPQLYAAQKNWAAEQTQSLKEYFARTGRKGEKVSGQWPVLTLS